MKILNTINNNIISFFKDTDEFVKNTPKTVIYYSTALKIFSFVLLIFKSTFPIYFLITAMLVFGASLYCDYKLISNIDIDHLVLVGIQKKIQSNPYKSGYYMGKICGTIIKGNFIERLKGFYKGFKEEIFL